MSNKETLKALKGPSELLVLLSIDVGSEHYDEYMQTIGLKKVSKTYFLGANMRYLRTKQGLNKEKLAYKLLMDVDKLTHYELDLEIPDVCRAMAIAEYFGVSVRDLVRIDLRERAEIYGKHNRENEFK